MKKTTISNHTDREVFIANQVKTYMTVTDSGVYIGNHSYRSNAKPGTICVDYKGNWFSLCMRKNIPGETNWPQHNRNFLWKLQSTRPMPPVIRALAAVYLN